MHPLMGHERQSGRKADIYISEYLELYEITTFISMSQKESPVMGTDFHLKFQSHRLVGNLLTATLPQGKICTPTKLMKIQSYVALAGSPRHLGFPVCRRLLYRTLCCLL